MVDACGVKRSTAVALSLLVVVGGCSGEISEVNDPANPDYYDPPVSGDAELPEDADVPLLPENNGEDAATETDASLEDASDDVTDASPEDVGLDAPAMTDAATRADVVAASDVATRPVDATPVTPRCTGSSSGQSSIWTCTSTLRARQRCVSGAVQTESCAYGCVAYPSGTNDVCAPMPTTLPACAHQSLLAWGLHPDASDHLRCAGVTAARITQTIGNAAASAGTHARDGYVGSAPYSAATDISVRGLSATDIRGLLSRMANQGFAGWYRWPGHDGWPSSEAPHIHAIYVGARMKSSLQSQVRDWLVGRNGLVSHTTYTFYTWTAAQRSTIRAVFERYN